MTDKTKQPKTYRVWIEQVNQTFVDVEATSAEDAKEKGYRKWRKEDAHARISDVQVQSKTTGEVV